MAVVEKGVEGGRGRGETMVLRGVHASPKGVPIQSKPKQVKTNQTTRIINQVNILQF